jgi:hypothetical protein
MTKAAQSGGLSQTPIPARKAEKMRPAAIEVTTP